MKLDLEHIMILLQRRYNVLREIKRLTDELDEAVSRNDQVSVSLLLKMRAEEMDKSEACQENIWLMAEEGPEEAQAVRKLLKSDPITARPSGSFEEQKIYEIRQKTIKLIKDIQEKDRNINRRVGGDRSYYSKAGK